MAAQTIVAPALAPAPATDAHRNRAAPARRRARICVHVLSLLLAAACRQKTLSIVDRYGDVPAPIPNGRIVMRTTDSLDIRRRADSLAALDPAREARAAIARGDMRYLAVCRLTCAVIGVFPDSICFVRDCAGFRRAEVLTIEGTEDLPRTPDLARLDSIAGVYGRRYNTILREFRSRSARRFPFAARSARYRARPGPRRLIIS